MSGGLHSQASALASYFLLPASYFLLPASPLHTTENTASIMGPPRSPLTSPLLSPNHASSRYHAGALRLARRLALLG